jgi:hypothetical protein
LVLELHNLVVLRLTSVFKLLNLIHLLIHLLFENADILVGQKQALDTNNLLHLMHDLFVWLVGKLLLFFDLVNDIFLESIGEVIADEDSEKGHDCCLETSEFLQDHLHGSEIIVCRLKVFNWIKPQFCFISVVKTDILRVNIQVDELIIKCGLLSEKVQNLIPERSSSLKQ